MIFDALYNVGNLALWFLLSWLPDADTLTLPNLHTATEAIVEYGKMFNWILPIEETLQVIHYGILIWFYIFLWKIIKMLIGFLPGFSMMASDTSGSNASGKFSSSSSSRNIRF